MKSDVQVLTTVKLYACTETLMYIIWFNPDLNMFDACVIYTQMSTVATEHILFFFSIWFYSQHRFYSKNNDGVQYFIFY